MNRALKHTPLGYFDYFYGSMGFKLVFNIILAVCLGFLDGVGLALFIPLLGFVNAHQSATSEDAMGGMAFVIESFHRAGVPLNLVSVLALMVLVFLVKGVLNFWLSMEQVDLRQKYMVSLRISQIEDMVRLSYKGFLKVDAGKIQNAVTTEIGRNIQAMIQFLSTTKSVIVLITYVILALMANWQFAMFIIAGGWLSNFLYKKITDSVKVSSLEISARGNLFSSYIMQAVYSFKYLKATSAFGQYALKLRGVIGEVERLNRKIGLNQAITASSREPVIILIVAIVILLQVNFMGSSLGSILLSLLLFYRALNGLVMVQMSWQSFMQNVGGLDSIAKLTHILRSEAEEVRGEEYHGFNSEIELRGVDFSYSTKAVLHNINISIPKNLTIGLIGESGSGKSTLANIVTGLLKPVAGEVLLDGTDLYKYDLNSFRSRIGYISQDPVIFSDNIYNNITFWAEHTEENYARFWEVVRKVSLYDFVNNLEEKEKTMLGDNGMLVSGGQKQRISIARELFKSADILILDEATSALDSETERFIQNSIEELQGEYTMIVIAHRLSTIKNADLIYLIDKGTVSAAGTYQDLLIQSERFRKMVDLQHV